MTKICVPIDTIVNDIPIKKHRAIQQKIADLTMENDSLKAEIAVLKANPLIYVEPPKTYEFKAGDRVKVVGNSPHNPCGIHVFELGTICEVISINVNQTLYVMRTVGDTRKQSILPTDLELLPPVCEYKKLCEQIRVVDDWHEKWGAE